MLGIIVIHPSGKEKLIIDYFSSLINVKLNISSDNKIS